MSRLLIFLSLYLSIFGLVHLYLLIKIRRAFYIHGVRYLLLATALLFLMLAPIQAHLLDNLGYWLPGLLMAWAGYLWLGFLFIFLCLALPLDVYHLVIRAAQGLTGADWTSMMLSRRQCLGVAVGLTFLVMAYGAFEAAQVQTEHITVPSAKIPADMPGLRLVQISDLHLGPMTYPGRLGSVIKAIKAAQPQMLLSTGDLIDGAIPGGESAASALREIAAPMGKFAVMGNHEHYHGDEASQKFIEAAGFTLLRDQALEVSPMLAIVGVDAAIAPHPGRTGEGDLLAPLSQNKFILLLKHRPRIDDNARAKFDLQLSGHTHGGQMFPFGFLLALRYPLPLGLVRLPEGNYLYTSRGTGSWGPPVRLLAPPEITVIDLVPAAEGPPPQAQ